MKLPVIVLDEAEAELEAAESWYEERRHGLGLEFRKAIDDAIHYLSSSPHAAGAVPGVAPEVGARRVFVKRFPYSVVFITEPDAIWVLAFVHHRRRPGYWKDRG